MILKIAGGCGEHGRNCFLIDTNTETFLVDCGIMQGSDKPFPRLTAEEIRRLNYVFLTHSHADHTGAIPWLYENGFCGKVIASAATLEQLAFPVKNAVSLEEALSGNPGRIGGVELEYGRAGHCVGSVWYHFFVGKKSVFFSGDYTENSLAYSCDNVRGRTADVAVLDCAYGNDARGFGEYRDEIISTVTRLNESHKTLVFPVPKYGRGLDLLKLFRERLPGLICCGDEHFMKQLGEIPVRRDWYRNIDISADPYQPGCSCNILFLSDPQLRSEKARSITEKILSQGGFAVMTGTVEHGSSSDLLVRTGKMKLLRYPVHQNYNEYRALAEKNNFRCVIPYHSENFCCERESLA